MSDMPRLFIASSSEGLSVAEAVNIKLEADFRVKQWDNAFDLSSVTIDALVNRAREVDYGVFVFHPDDKTTIRENEYSVVRDNVLFELGIFIGALGLDHCFILVPRSTELEFRLPTDLAGVTTTAYDDQLEDKVDAVATSCAKIKQIVRKHRKETESAAEQPTEVAVLQKQLTTFESQVWRLSTEAEHAQEKAAAYLGIIRQQFFAIAKPATLAEVKAWEDGAASTYLKEVKVQDSRAYFVDQPVAIPPLYGAEAIAVIIAAGVNVYGADNSGHNNLYYMDGFRTNVRM